MNLNIEAPKSEKLVLGFFFIILFSLVIGYAVQQSHPPGEIQGTGTLEASQINDAEDPLNFYLDPNGDSRISTLQVSTDLQLESLTSCNTLDTDSNGFLTCGIDETGVSYTEVVHETDSRSNPLKSNTQDSLGSRSFDTTYTNGNSWRMVNILALHDTGTGGQTSALKFILDGNTKYFTSDPGNVNAGGLVNHIFMIPPNSNYEFESYGYGTNGQNTNVAIEEWHEYDIE